MTSHDEVEPWYLRLCGFLSKPLRATLHDVSEAEQKTSSHLTLLLSKRGCGETYERTAAFALRLKTGDYAVSSLALCKPRSIAPEYGLNDVGRRTAARECPMQRRMGRSAFLGLQSGELLCEERPHLVMHVIPPLHHRLDSSAATKPTAAALDLVCHVEDALPVFAGVKSSHNSTRTAARY